MEQKPRLMLIDGNSLLYRAFYALPLLRTRKGLFTNAIYGFLNMLFRVQRDYQPTHVVVAFDKDRRTMRTEEYEAYKSHRPPAPQELREQFLILREVLKALGVSYLELEGYEADDLIGTLTRQAEEQGLPSVVVTGDQDALQLVSPTVEVLLTRRGITDMEHYDLERVREKWGIAPGQLPDLKGLMGDASDNIPGVPGVGKKTALKLVQEHSSMERLYERLDAVRPQRLAKLLAENREQAFLSRRLATIMRDVPLEVNLEDFAVHRPDRAALVELYRELEFTSFLKDLQSQPQEEGTGAAAVRLSTPAELAGIADCASRSERLSLYLATDHPNPMWGKVTECCLACGGEVHRLRLDGDRQELVRGLQPMLEDSRVRKYVHDSKSARVALSRLGISLQGVWGDTLLISYVLDPGYQGESLSEHLFHYLGQVVDLRADPARGVALLEDLYELLQEKVQEEELFSLYREVELPLASVLADMETEGVRVDPAILQEISRELEGRIEQIQERIYQLAGHPFNINSTRQLAQVLFEDLGLPVVKKTKTGYSTSVEVLEELYGAHEIIGHIMDYRTLTKLKSTYVDALPGYIHPETGRIHTIFKQTVTATGRLSSVEPNLQNIPIRDEEGRRIRKAFVARDQDHLLVSGDYSQIDLRVLAHVSGDETLIDTFRRNIDIHARTASEIFRVPLEQVDANLRRRAKAVNFGIVYGISDFGLARQTGVSRQEARQYIDAYLDCYPGVRQYMQEVVETGRELGFVSTILGRRRYLPDLLSSNRGVRAAAERMALNAPIQGSSADIIKLAMLALAEEFAARGLQARMILQVHDELVFDVPRREVDEVVPLIRDCMEHACQLKVPLEVGIKTGPNWYDMEAWE